MMIMKKTTPDGMWLSYEALRFQSVASRRQMKVGTKKVRLAGLIQFFFFFTFFFPMEQLLIIKDEQRCINHGHHGTMMDKTKLKKNLSR